MKIATVIGARPQFIKAAVVSRAFKAHQNVTEVLIHTGQHHDDNMSDIFFRELDIPKPAHHLGIAGGSHGRMTGRQLEAIEAVFLADRPDWVLVYGDTNSTLAGALAAAKLHIPVAHVEAGLRSFNRRMPEEINRVLTDHVSALLFAPTGTAAANLAAEGVEPALCHVVGDVMFDAARFYAQQAQDRSAIIDAMGLEAGRFCLVTVHRQENTDIPQRLSAIFAALRDLARTQPVVLPLHPRTRKMLQASGDFAIMTQGLDIIDPVGMFDIIELMRNASLVLTDSGGLQKESYFHGTPAVVLRDETEWTELLQIGWARLCPPVSADAILTAARAPFTPTGDANPFGDGHAGKAIVDRLLSA